MLSCMKLLMLYCCMFGMSPLFCVMTVGYAVVMVSALLNLGMWESDGNDVAPGDNSGVPPPAPANWQEMLAAMEARMLRAEEEARMYKRQVKRLTSDAVVQPVPALVLFH